jgi:hypothetical protein
MNERNPVWRVFLAVFAVCPMTRQQAQERDEPKPSAGNCACSRSRTHGRFMGCFYCLSLWLSLPLAIWLSGGWVGLIGHWQALSGVACLLEKARLSPQSAFRAIFAGTEISQGEPICGLVKSEAV